MDSLINSGPLRPESPHYDLNQWGQLVTKKGSKLAGLSRDEINKAIAIAERELSRKQTRSPFAFESAVGDSEQQFVAVPGAPLRLYYFTPNQDAVGTTRTVLDTAKGVFLSFLPSPPNRTLSLEKERDLLIAAGFFSDVQVIESSRVRGLLFPQFVGTVNAVIKKNDNASLVTMCADLFQQLGKLHESGWTHQNITRDKLLLGMDGRVYLTGFENGKPGFTSKLDIQMLGQTLAEVIWNFQLLNSKRDDNQLKTLQRFLESAHLASGIQEIMKILNASLPSKS